MGEIISLEDRRKKILCASQNDRRREEAYNLILKAAGILNEMGDREASLSWMLEECGVLLLAKDDERAAIEERNATAFR